MRFFLFFIFYLLISPAFATVQPIEFDAKSTFVGKKALVVASRKTLQEVDQLIKTFNNSPMWGNSKPNWQIFLSSNGWYGISLGIGTTAECDRNKKLLINNNLIPKDSYCSSGKKFVKHISHNGNSFYLKDGIIEKSNKSKNSSKESESQTNWDNHLSEKSDTEICNIAVYESNGITNWVTNDEYYTTYVEEAKKRKLKCGVSTPEEIEAKRIAQEEAQKRKEEAQKRKDESRQKALEVFNQNRLLEAENNPGFRDIKPGKTYNEIFEKANCGLTKQFNTCYGLENMAFAGEFSYKTYEYNFTNENGNLVNGSNSAKVLTRLVIDLGPIVSGGFFSGITSEGADDGDIFNGMRNTLNKKYTTDFEFSERDRELFNEGEKSRLFVVYENGKVVLRIWRKKEEYSSQLRLHLEYRDTKSGADFLEANKPKKASASDF